MMSFILIFQIYCGGVFIKNVDWHLRSALTVLLVDNISAYYYTDPNTGVGLLCSIQKPYIILENSCYVWEGKI